MKSDIRHYGVKGMKWGVIKSKTTGRRRKNPSSEDHNESRALKKRKLRTLSNAEIAKVNKRLQLEQNYRKLNPGHVARGKALAKGIIATAGTAASLYAIKDNVVVKNIVKTARENASKGVAVVS